MPQTIVVLGATGTLHLAHLAVIEEGEQWEAQ